MLKRALALLLCVLGVVAIGLGIASATAWRSSDTLEATAGAGDAHLMVTDPGVLDLAADDVTVRAEADAGTVLVALARTSEVDAWVGDERVTRVTGLTDTSTLTTRSTGTEPETPGDPRGADLWVEEWTGDGEVTVPLSADSGRWSILVASVGDDAAPPTLTLTWPQEVTTPYLAPLVAVGSVLLLAGLAWLAWILWNERVKAQRAASRARRAAGAETGAPGAGAGAVSAPTPAGEPGDRPLTRRELREREQQARERQAGGHAVRTDPPTGADATAAATGAANAAMPTSATNGPTSAAPAPGTTGPHTSAAPGPVTTSPPAADRAAALERLRALARRGGAPQRTEATPGSSSEGTRNAPGGLSGTGLPGVPAPGDAGRGASGPRSEGLGGTGLPGVPAPGSVAPPPGGPAVPPRRATAAATGEAWRRTWGIPAESRTWVPEPDRPADAPAVDDQERPDTQGHHPTGEEGTR